MSVPSTDFYKPLPKKDASSDVPQPSTPPSTTLSLPTSTPVVHKQSGTHTFTSKGHLRSSLNMHLANETRGQFLGPMPPTKFLNKFLPAGVADCPSADKAFSELQKAQTEQQMYTPFIEAATPFAPGLTFIDTHLNPDTKCASLAPDISPYLSGNCPLGERKTDFSLMEFIVEFKFSEGEDPFRDPDDPLTPKANDFRFEVDTKDARKVRGQLSSYVSALLGSQFRLHTFVILIFGKYARLMFWDRSGATVTHRFIYARHGEAPRHFLPEFLWRYSHASPFQRGHDPTVRPTLPGEVKKFGNATKQLQKENSCHSEFRIMMIPDRDDPTVERDFLISYPPQHKTCSPFGRATRPMVACDMDGNSVFIKDYWRTVVPGMEKEGEIYKILEQHKVPHIAPFGVGNDVRDYTTVTHTLRNEDWACWTSEMVQLRLYRMSMNVVGRSLTNFKSSREYVMAVADAMEAHDGAYFDAKILHRDISVGNIIMTESGEGLLIDWDLCLNLANNANGARRPNRTGTWQFMSAALLQNPELRQDLQDDRESAFHVLSWIALRYTKHNKLHELSSLLDVYDECHDTAAGARGGRGKLAFMDHDCKTLEFDRRPALTELVRSLAVTISVRYDDSPIPKADIEEVHLLLLNLDTDPPGPQDIPAIYSLLSPPDPVDFGRQLQAYPFALAKLKIRKRGWLVRSIRHFADDDPRWHESDKAELNPIIGGSTGKRKIQTDFEDRIPSTKSMKLLNGGSSRTSEQK